MLENKFGGKIYNIPLPSNTQQVKTADLNMSYVITSWSLAFIRFKIFSFTAEGNDLQNQQEFLPELCRALSDYVI